MRIEMNCCCGATYVGDDTKDGDAYHHGLKNDAGYWRGQHKECPVIYAARPGAKHEPVPTGCLNPGCMLTAGHEGECIQ